MNNYIASFGLSLELFALAACGQAIPQDSGNRQKPDRAVYNVKSAPLSHEPSTPLTIFVYRVSEKQYAEVFDVANNRMAVRSYDNIAPPHRPEVSGEFSGPLGNCDSRLFKCFDSGLFIVLPRQMPWPGLWRYHGMECRKISETDRPKPKTYTARCEYSNGFATVFEYVSTKGIVSLRRECADCPRRQLVLMGDKGLFYDLYDRDVTD
jgi:hypothetical protein